MGNRTTLCRYGADLLAHFNRAYAMNEAAQGSAKLTQQHKNDAQQVLDVRKQDIRRHNSQCAQCTAAYAAHNEGYGVFQ
jgi:hypothetical protein